MKKADLEQALLEIIDLYERYYGDDGTPYEMARIAKDALGIEDPPPRTAEQHEALEAWVRNVIAQQYSGIGSCHDGYYVDTYDVAGIPEPKLPDQSGESP